MTKWLRQSTAAKVILGPMVNSNASSSGVPVTAITFAVNEIIAIPHDTTTSVDLSTRTISHLGAGLFSISLLAADTSICGGMRIGAGSSAATYRPASSEFMVLTPLVYDSLVPGTDYLQVDAEQLGGNAIGAFLNGTSAVNADVTKLSTNATAAANLSAAGLAVTQGIAATGSTTTVVLTNLTAAVNSHYVGQIIKMTSGALAGRNVDEVN